MLVILFTETLERKPDIKLALLEITCIYLPEVPCGAFYPSRLISDPSRQLQQTSYTASRFRKPVSRGQRAGEGVPRFSSGADLVPSHNGQGDLSGPARSAS